MLPIKIKNAHRVHALAKRMAGTHMTHKTWVSGHTFLLFSVCANGCAHCRWFCAQLTECGFLPVEVEEVGGLEAPAPAAAQALPEEAGR